jgi:transposase
MPIDGATAAEGCRVCGEPVRRPPWRPGDMVIMDHLRAHHATGIQKAMEQAGAGLWSVPPYSPDVSPIERGWSTLKTAWRKAQARTREARDHAIAQALATITRSNARSWFHHGGDTFTSDSRTALGEHKVAVPVYEDPRYMNPCWIGMEVISVPHIWLAGCQSLPMNAQLKFQHNDQPRVISPYLAKTYWCVPTPGGTSLRLAPHSIEYSAI